MKVLQINATYGYGSTGLIVKNIGEMLNNSGHEAFFAYQTTNIEVVNGYQIGNLFDWKFHALYTRIFGKQAYDSRWTTKKFLKWIDEIQPDIVHLHNLHSNYINLNFILNYLAKKDISAVITMHDCWYFTGKCFHYADVGCDRFMSGCGECPKKNTPPKSLFFDQSSKVLRDRYQYLSKLPRITLVGCSQWICGEAKKSWLKDLPIEQIYNGVDIEIFKEYDNLPLRERYHLEVDTYVVMGMANKWLLPSNKQLLTETIKILNSKLKLMIVGCEKEEIDYLMRLSENIIPVGFIKDRVELAKHYSFSNVFVNVTHVDTLPTVNMESICCGTPVITYDSCGSPELILNGCGKVVKENDIEMLLSVINNKIKKIQSEDLAVARFVYDKNESYKKYLQIYARMTNQRD